MDSIGDVDEKAISELLEQEQRAQERNDLQDEIAGRSNGRMRRFLNDEGDGDGPYGKRSKDASSLTALEWLLLNDPVYAKRHREFGDFLRHAEAATETAILHAKHALRQAQDTLQDILDNANRLPDGTRVFRAADGRVMDENGNEVSKEDAASIVWKDGAPDYEEYLAAQDAASAAQGRTDDLQAYQVDVLGNARNRWEDKTDPISMEEMETMTHEIEAKMSAYAGGDPDSAPSPPQAVEQTIAAVDIPNL